MEFQGIFEINVIIGSSYYRMFMKRSDISSHTRYRNYVHDRIRKKLSNISYSILYVILARWRGAIHDFNLFHFKRKKRAPGLGEPEGREKRQTRPERKETLTRDVNRESTCDSQRDSFRRFFYSWVSWIDGIARRWKCV